MKYYCVRNKFNNVLGYGNTDRAVTEDYREQFHNDDNFDIIEVEHYDFKRRRWLFWLLIIPLTIATIWIWSRVFTSCDYHQDMKRQSRTIEIPEDEV